MHVAVNGPIGRVTLDAPDRLNAVDTAMLTALADAFEELGARQDVRVITLTGTGHGFCAGVNLFVREGEEIGAATVQAAGRAVQAMTKAPQAVVSLVNGVAAGVGMSLALAADYCLASESASFVLAFSKIGLMPDGGATELVAASVGRARAMRLALTAENLTAARAAEVGLIAEAVADASFSARSEAVVDHLLSLAPRATELTKLAINAATLDLESTLEREERGQVALLASTDFDEGAAAFRERRPAVFPGG
ncbi:enoyl-CoA hydratase [Janibacter sp. HTCC2649]|nr:enoyl-CoA hydratase [Janibacter sp. HTCC2649]